MLIFFLEDGGDTFLRNVSSHADYTAVFPRRWQLLFLLFYRKNFNEGYWKIRKEYLGTT
jgi:hypothetical protein